MVHARAAPHDPRDRRLDVPARRWATYDADTPDPALVAATYRRDGFFFAPYVGGDRHYGLSLASSDFVLRTCREASPGQLERVRFEPRGWADHQDVHGFRRVSPSRHPWTPGRPGRTLPSRSVRTEASMRLSNQVVLITGGSAGIGRATALALAARGNRIAVTARREAVLREAGDAIRAAGGEPLCLAGDATDAAHADHVVSEVVARWGRIDIALLNVGGGVICNTLTASRDKILGTMRANFDGMINFFVPVLAQMRRQQDPCLIANVNSLSGYFGIPMQGDYTAAKNAARVFLDTVRMELRHFGVGHIRIQTIHPGFVETASVHRGGNPTPGIISAEEAARRILAGFESEVPENRFPATTALATRIGRLAPRWLRTRVLLAAVPRQY